MPDILGALDALAPKMSAEFQETVRQAREKDDKLHKATHDMEGYFVGTLLKKMHETAAKGGLFDKDSASATYREMFDDAIAGEVGKKGAFGIADMLYKEFTFSGGRRAR